MKVFEISEGVVKEGASVTNVYVKSGKFSYKAISVGEPGKGRLVANLPVDERAIIKNDNFPSLLRADLGNTRRGMPKLTKEFILNDSKCIVVFREKIGFRGSNDYTGNRILEKSNNSLNSYLEFPGLVITEGIIAQGRSGQLGKGRQIIAVIPRCEVFRVSHSDRLQVISSYYYLFDGDKIHRFG